MKSFSLFLFASLALASVTMAQVKVFKGTSKYSSDVICTFSDEKVFKKHQIIHLTLFVESKGIKFTREQVVTQVMSFIQFLMVKFIRGTQLIPATL